MRLSTLKEPVILSLGLAAIMLLGVYTGYELAKDQFRHTYELKIGICDG